LPRAAVLATALGLLLGTAATPAHAADPALPGGVLVELRTSDGAQVSAGTVALTTPDGDVVSSAPFDGGYADVSGLEPGDYLVRFDVGGTRQWAYGARTAADATVITVDPGETAWVSDTLLGPVPTGVVSGVVRDQVTREPLAGICLEAMGDESSGYACSASDGRYTVDELAPGQYQVATIKVGDHHLDTSATVTVTGESPAALDLALPQAGRITTTVRDARTGAAAAEVCVEAYSLARGGTVRGDCSGSDGAVSLGGLVPGRYVLRTSSSDVYGAQWVLRDGRGTGVPEQAGVLVVRGLADLRAAAVRVAAAGSISGIVRDKATGKPVKGVCAYVFASSMGAGPDGGAHCTGTNGRYAIAGVGPYGWAVQFASAEGKYAWEWSGGAADRLHARQVTVRSGATATMDAALPLGGRLEGTVRGADGAPAGASVNAVNALTGEPAAGYAVAYPDDEFDVAGHYAVVGLATQKIKVRYQLDDGTTAWYGGTSFADARPVSVRAGSVTRLDLAPAAR
jgi:hypothetical protein